MYKLIHWSFLAIALYLPVTSMAETYYRWVDEDKVTHYTRQPPGNYPYEKIDTFTGRSTSVAPQSTVDKNKETAETLSKTASSKPTKDPAICKRAKANLKTLTEHALIRQKNEYGEVVVLNEKKKKDEIERAQKAIKDNCK